MKAARDMLNALYERGVGAYIEVRRIDRSTHRVAQEFIPPAAMDYLLDHVGNFARRMDVYIGVAMRTEKSGGKDAIEGVQALWADVDGTDATLALVSFDLPPSIVVASGSPGCTHAYWLLDEAISVPEAEDLLRLLATRLGSDRAVTDASRILRLPGTYNHKTDPPTPVELNELNDRIYSAQQFRAVLQLEQGSSTSATRIDEAPGPRSRPVARLLGQLDTINESGNGWTARCPAHDDTRPSLSIAQAADGSCLVHCFAGCTVEEVVAAVGLGLTDLFADDAHAGRKSTEQRLVDLVQDADVELFHDPQGRAFAAYDVAGHRECWPIDSGSFSRSLKLGYFRAYGHAPSAEKLRSTIDLFSAQAEFDGPEVPVHRRVGGDLERLVIDLGDGSWCAVEVTAEGWRVLEHPDIRFQREAGSRALPVPVAGGSLKPLRRLFNVADPADWTRIRGGLIGAFHPSGPYLVTFVIGPSGSGKSFASRQLASLIDPFNPQEIVGTPGAHDLLVAASKTLLTMIDNVSSLSRPLSDTLAVISTGAGDRRRALYTNDDLFALVAKGPLLVTCLTQVARFPDLISRGNFVRLEQIPKGGRRREDELLAEFGRVRPSVFGRLLDLLVGGLAHTDQVTIPNIGRMADVATLVTAAEHVMDVPIGSFCAAIEDAQEEARNRAAEATPFVEAVIKLIETIGERELSMTELLGEAGTVPGVDTKARAWPRSANAASHQLDEHAATLADHGIAFSRDRRPGGNRDRFVRLAKEARDEGHPGTMFGNTART